MRRALTLTAACVCAVVLTACARTASTGNFKGVEHDVAQVLANLQSQVTAGEQGKICGETLAAPVVTKLGGKKGCEAAVKEQLSEIDGTDVEVSAVHVSGKTATASVKSTYSGKKNRPRTVELVEEGGKWRIAAIQP